MEKSGFVADPIYGEIKNEIMANTLENGEKVDIEDIMKRFQVSKRVAFSALHCLHKSGIVCKNIGESGFSVAVNSEAEHREKSRLKLAFFHLNYAVQKLQEQDAEVCATCLRKELVYIKLAAKINMPINKKQLKIELLSHMKPMVNRMNHQINIKNNLLSDIKLEYGRLFEIIKETANDVAKTFKLNTISDDEVGYITIYFAKHMEASPLVKRIIIMCSSGIGTSELLKVKVQKAFPDVEIVDVLSSTRFKNNLQDYQNIDFILTTINAESTKEIPSLLVSAMFTEKDKIMVKKLMESL